MVTRVFVTPDAAARLTRAAELVQPGDPVGAGIVLTTAAHLAAWPAPAPGTLFLALGRVGNGAVRPFLELPTDADGPILDRAVAAAEEVLRLRAAAAEAEADASAARARQLELARVGIALTAELDLDRLLQRILTTGRELVDADAGSLYLIEEAGGIRLLRFVLAQNDSVPARLATTTMPLDPGSLAGYVALTGEPVSVEDVRSLPADSPYRFNPAFDLSTGYHTRSLLTAPMATRAGEVIGVLQLINRKSDRSARILDNATADAVVLPFGAAEVEVIRAMAAQAAVAIENTRLVQEIERLFEGFVRASVRAIEQRDPSTSGHSLRVAHYTISLARALEADPPPAFRGLCFSRDELTQIRYASLLHDFGKVGVREAVLTKGKKLFPERMALIKERFCHARRAREVAVLRGLLTQLVEAAEAPTARHLEELEAAVLGAVRELDGHLATILVANEPTVLEQATAHLLDQVAHGRFPGQDGLGLPLLLPDEIRALSVAKGSLDEEERREMEDHVVHSYQFLLTIPWPRRFRRVPAIAYGHHEKLNGRGYPNRLLATQIPLEVRMMTVADIFDALSAGDRPYKRAVSPERALAIIEDEARAGLLDPDLVRLFVDARVYANPVGDLQPI